MFSKISRQVGAVFSAIGILLCIISGFYISAEEQLDGSLTLICRTDEVTLTGLKWNLYRVGSRHGGEFLLEGDFEEYPVSLKDFSVEGMVEAGSTLENFAIIDKIPPISSGETDENGILEFGELEEGLYMVSGKILRVGDTFYVPSAILFEITRELDGGHQQLDLMAFPKFHYRVLSQQDAQYTVRKVWQNDEDTPENRSTSITVEMYKDGEYDSTVVLDDSNDWTYTWTAKSHIDWRVKEVDIPENYTVVYRSNETQYLIVNTYEKPETPTTTTQTSTTTTTTTTQTETQSQIQSTTQTQTQIQTTNKIQTTVRTTTPVYNTTTTSPTKLPQTGQLWWPVPIFAGGGVVFISIGMRLRSKK